MKSLKSIFSSCSSQISVSTQKNKRERVKSEHFLRFWKNAASLLWIFLNSNEEPPRLCSLLCFLSRTSDERRKNKNEETSYLIVHVRDVFVAVDVVQPLLPFRFFKLFQLFQLLFRLIGFGRVSTRRTRRHLFLSFSLADEFEFDSIRTSKTIDEMRALFNVSFSLQQQRKRERKMEAFIINAGPLLKLLHNNNRNRNNNNERALCCRSAINTTRVISFWRKWMKFQKILNQKFNLSKWRWIQYLILELETTTTKLLY